MLWVSGRPDGHQQGELIAADGVLIPYREWRRSDAEAVVVYLHGQGDHSGPFTAMGDELHGRGLNVYAHDHRGFGLSGERRGDIQSYEVFIDDIEQMIAHARERNPGKPIFVLGLSMGGHLALRAAARVGNRIAGVIALSPGFKLRKSPSWRQVAQAVLLWLTGSRRYMPTVSENIITTRNQYHLERAQQDENWVTAFTGRFYVEAVLSIRKARQELPFIPVPVLTLQAGEDHLICPVESRRFFERIQHPDKEFRLLEGLCHNLVAEPEMPQIAGEVASWIRQRAPNPSMA